MSVFIITVLLLLTCFLSYVIYRLVNDRAEFENDLVKSIDASIRILDTCHNQILTVANKPVFFDSPEVRQVVNSIKTARYAVLDVIDILSDIDAEETASPTDLPKVEYVNSDGVYGESDSNDIKARNDAIVRGVKEGRIDVLQPQRFDVNSSGGDGVRSPGLLMALNRHKNRSAGN